MLYLTIYITYGILYLTDQKQIYKYIILGLSLNIETKPYSTQEFTNFPERTRPKELS